MSFLSPLAVCAFGFAMLVAALVGFSTLDAYSEQYWKIALASPPTQMQPAPPEEPSSFKLSGHDPAFRRKCYELALDATGLAGTFLIIVGIIMHLRTTNAAGLPM